MSLYFEAATLRLYHDACLVVEHTPEKSLCQSVVKAQLATYYQNRFSVFCNKDVHISENGCGITDCFKINRAPNGRHIER